MIEKAGKILQVDSRYALVQITTPSRSTLLTKLYTVLSPNYLLNSTTTIRARNSIYAHPNDIVIVGLPSQHFWKMFITQTSTCISNTAIILRCTAPVAESC
ncbi:MAG TPA: hypothetical protein ENJ33_08615 [Thiothrix sp.]|nr:hypothetical protein [Thiothrix sp.]